MGGTNKRTVRCKCGRKSLVYLITYCECANVEWIRRVSVAARLESYMHWTDQRSVHGDGNDLAVPAAFLQPFSLVLLVCTMGPASASSLLALNQSVSQAASIFSILYSRNSLTQCKFSPAQVDCPSVV